MRLKTYSYRQFPHTPREWNLTGLTLGLVNLVVGKNASGKSRALNTINGLGKLVSGRQKPSELSTGIYSATFEYEGRTLKYTLDIQERKVFAEEFVDDGKIRLRRGSGGKGVIYHEKEGQDLEFQTPEGEVAVVARQDSIQHSFFKPLTEWGEGVRHYAFGDKMGHGVLTLTVEGAPSPDPRDVDAVAALFRKGAKDFPNRFAETVRDDMNAIGYQITEVGVMAPTDIEVKIPVGPKIEPRILFVQERDLPCVTQQTDMSQGMFRALSVIILLNYAAIASRPSCILVDDIGEGLDFDRSCKLIEVITSRAQSSGVQIVLSTNDRFVMNAVPLEAWSILQRQGGSVEVRNYANSKKHFDTFRFTGLNNFDFFRYDFINENPDAPVEEVGAMGS